MQPLKANWAGHRDVIYATGATNCDTKPLFLALGGNRKNFCLGNYLVHSLGNASGLSLWAIRFLLNPLWAVVIDPQNIHGGTGAVFVCCNIGQNHASNKSHLIIPQKAEVLRTKIVHCFTSGMH